MVSVQIVETLTPPTIIPSGGCYKSRICLGSTEKRQILYPVDALTQTGKSNLWRPTAVGCFCSKVKFCYEESNTRKYQRNMLQYRKCSTQRVGYVITCCMRVYVSDFNHHRFRQIPWTFPAQVMQMMLRLAQVYYEQRSQVYGQIEKPLPFLLPE